MSAKDVDKIDAAVFAHGGALKPEDRFDLRQAIALKLLERRPEGDVGAWARVFARDWVRDFLRGEAQERAVREAVRVRAPVPGWRRDGNWLPTWYPPCEGAKEFAPFACEGARVMHCKPGWHGKSEG